MSWLKYSGIWAGLVVNPYHWRLKWESSDARVFENCIYVGPVWIRVIIDNGKW